MIRQRAESNSCNRLTKYLYSQLLIFTITVLTKILLIGICLWTEFGQTQPAIRRCNDEICNTQRCDEVQSWGLLARLCITNLNRTGMWLGIQITVSIPAKITVYSSGPWLERSKARQRSDLRCFDLYSWRGSVTFPEYVETTSFWRSFTSSIGDINSRWRRTESAEFYNSTKYVVEFWNVRELWYASFIIWWWHLSFGRKV